MIRGNVIAIAPRTVSTETVHALEQLLERARSGDLVGGGWFTFHLGSAFEVDVVGEARRRPDFARGVLRRLDAVLASIEDLGD